MKKLILVIFSLFTLGAQAQSMRYSAKVINAYANSDIVYNIEAKIEQDHNVKCSPKTIGISGFNKKITYRGHCKNQEHVFKLKIISTWEDVEGKFKFEFLDYKLKLL